MRLAAPDIGRADEALRRRHPVRRDRLERRDVSGEDEPIGRDADEAVGLLEHFHPRVQGQQVARRVLDVGAGQNRRGQCRDPMRRFDRIAADDGMDVADIAVDRGLAPGPAGFRFVDREGLAEQQLVVLQRILRRGMAERGAAARDGHDAALREGRGRDLAFQLRGGEIGPRRNVARIAQRSALRP